MATVSVLYKNFWACFCGDDDDLYACYKRAGYAFEESAVCIVIGAIFRALLKNGVRVVRFAGVPRVATG